MAFAINPFSLSVPDPAFESWLRDSGYLEVLDDHSAATAAAVAPAPAPLAAGVSPPPNSVAASADHPKARSLSSAFSAVLSSIQILTSVVTLNPFSKLERDDFVAATPSWTSVFIGDSDSYSLPARPAQARMRIQENVRRYARNYAFLTILFFACTLYKLPIALFGLLATMALWELLRICCSRWELESRNPGLRNALLRLVQFATAVVLYMCNIQLAIACSVGVGYTVMILHASFRKLAPSKQPTRVVRAARGLWGPGKIALR